MISREDLIVQSIEDHVRDGLFNGYNYPSERVELIDGFDADFFDEHHSDGLSKTFVAIAFQFDNGGVPIEMGSSLTSYLHTIDFIVLGHTPTWGRNVAHIIKAILRTESETIPLRDYNVATEPRPILAPLLVEEVSTEREFMLDPRPWQQFAWTTRLRITDETYAPTPV